MRRGMVWCVQWKNSVYIAAVCWDYKLCTTYELMMTDTSRHPANRAMSSAGLLNDQTRLWSKLTIYLQIARRWSVLCMLAANTQLHTTQWAVKTRHFILDHNFHVSWWMFTLLVSMERVMNAPQRSYKICNFTLTVSRHYLIETKNTHTKRHILKSFVTFYFITQQQEWVHEVSELFLQVVGKLL